MALKVVGLGTLLPGCAIVLYLLARVTTDSAGLADYLRWLLAFLLSMGLAVGVLYSAVLFHIEVPIVYANGLDARDHFVLEIITGRTFHPWSEFYEVRVGRITIGTVSFVGIELMRRHGPTIVFEDTDYGSDFIHAIEHQARMAEGIRVLPTA